MRARSRCMEADAAAGEALAFFAVDADGGGNGEPRAASPDGEP